VEATVEAAMAVEIIPPVREAAGNYHPQFNRKI